MSRFRITYAQNREDIILSGFFDGLEDGFYVDVGANHPDLLSITKIFYDKGWHGINIEPNKSLYNLITQSRPRDINLNVGAADAAGELVLREYPEGDGLSTFSKETQANYEKSSSEYRRYTEQYKDYKVKVKTLKDIFDEHKVKDINFMNIDVEGFEYQVIKGNDWNKYRPQVLCIEANHIIKDWRPLLKEANYDLVFFDGLNNYYVANERKDMAGKFSYVKTLLLGKPPIPASFYNEFIETGRALRQSERKLKQFENKLIRQEIIEQDLRVEIHNLYAKQAADKRLRALVKQFIVALHEAVLVQIEKLNKPKVKRQKPLMLASTQTPAGMLPQLRLYDLERYYGLKTSQPLSYRLVFKLYTGSYNALKSGAKGFVKTLRKARHGK